MLRESNTRAQGVLVGAAAVAVLTSGCAGGAGRSADSLVAQDEAAATGALGAAPQPVDAEAPATHRPVARNGVVPNPTVKAAAGRFSAAAPVTYPDGVSLSVDRVSRQVERSVGAGAFPGRPSTALTLTLVNGTPRPLDLSQVVVTTTYGARKLLAAPVYEDERVQDFTGTVPAGATATATYGFAIPPGQAKTVSTFVDFDAVHAAAAFVGLEEG